ncbi:flagellar export chaperone FliS [Exiguobacterium sp. Leaf187]|uniref:flagellar export chaperone FliS n=1 Tax=Exiguobacterium TaxID=33986 RepID=UPI0003C3B06F|nr:MULTISPECIES: flagellar export chaperone FliS [Exiguobacterium]AHA30637.1 flagellar biosynthesis protein FliS [Exiguobacterium sp. MH3]KQS19874.1 flagellar export chaperone FliS [Exiguobacterium sp. Leaf187]MCQ4089326.1 flagellar export chaperone FliS [Exiguobacterium sp. LL15]
MNPYASYQTNSVTTALPQDLTLMLYEGLIKFSMLSKQAIEQGMIEQKNTNIQKAQAIISELQLTLNQSIALSKDLNALYDYMQVRLIDANIKNDIVAIDEVIGFAEEFRETWKEAMKLAKQR